MKTTFAYLTRRSLLIDITLVVNKVTPVGKKIILKPSLPKGVRHTYRYPSFMDPRSMKVLTDPGKPDVVPYLRNASAGPFIFKIQLKIQIIRISWWYV